MGTTLALNGAYNLAGSLLNHTSEQSLDYTSAFAQYESKMRPLVQRAQKLPPGIPHIIHPQTAWGVWFMRSLAYCMQWSGISYALAVLKGPPARAIQVEDYGIRQEVMAKGEADR
jgi:2-polyprenyl-6-methoxyphenol hydroxylase-like FAD-dependent oxidoreductase